jgi:hypothetical protein
LSVGFLSAAAAMAAPVTALAQYAQPVAIDSAVQQPVAQPNLPPPPPSGNAPVMYVDNFGQPLGAPPPGMIFVDQNGQPLPPPAQTLVPVQARARTRQPARSRAIIGASVHYLAIADSSYGRSAGLWGYSGFHNATTYAIDGGVHVLPYLMIGARGGYASASGGNANFDGAELQMQMMDFGLLVRAGYPVAMRGGWMFFPGVQLEAGAANASTTLRGESQSALIPRIAGNLILMVSSPHLGLSVRLGYSSAHWADAGGRGVDLELGGFSAGLGAEIRL